MHTENLLNVVKLHILIFTELAPRPIQSISHNVHLYVCLYVTLRKKTLLVGLETSGILFLGDRNVGGPKRGRPTPRFSIFIRSSARLLVCSLARSSVSEIKFWSLHIH